jgi:hypothetical protein
MLHQSQRIALLEFRRNVFGVLLVAFKDLQAGREQIFEFCVARVGNKCALQRGIDRLVIGYLIVDVGLVERLAVELGELARLSAACVLNALLVSLSSGVTPSFFTSANAFSFTAL